MTTWKLLLNQKARLQVIKEELTVEVANNALYIARVNGEIASYVEMPTSDMFSPHDIRHEDLAGISQHDWYLTCYEISTHVELENVLYCVVCIENGSDKQYSFTNLADLNAWAGY